MSQQVCGLCHFQACAEHRGSPCPPSRLCRLLALPKQPHSSWWSPVHRDRDTCGRGCPAVTPRSSGSPCHPLSQGPPVPPCCGCRGQARGQRGADAAREGGSRRLRHCHRKMMAALGRLSGALCGWGRAQGIAWVWLCLALLGFAWICLARLGLACLGQRDGARDCSARATHLPQPLLLPWHCFAPGAPPACPASLLVPPPQPQHGPAPSLPPPGRSAPRCRAPAPRTPLALRAPRPAAADALSALSLALGRV